MISEVYNFLTALLLIIIIIINSNRLWEVISFLFSLKRNHF